MKAPEMAPPQLAGLTFVRKLGTGGYSSVFLYEQDLPRMRVAVKVLAADGVSESVRRRFAAEANAMAQLADHPNIVQVFRADTTPDGRPYLVMKYYPQRNLAERAKIEPIPLFEVLDIGVRISCAVETAHRAGILHRDIKPANILTSQYGEPGLADFGIATSKSADGTDEAEGMSIPWSPPEVLFGTSPADERSDIYSLGATVWHLVVGRSPFEAADGDNSSVALMRRIREQNPPRTGRSDIPGALDRLLMQTIAKDPGMRPASAVDFARVLQEIEVEQRWTATPLILPDSGENPLPSRADSPDSDDRTRLRSPQRVVAQSPSAMSSFAPPTAAPGTAPAVSTSTVGKVTPPSARPDSSTVDDATVSSDRVRGRERVGIGRPVDRDSTRRRPPGSVPSPQASTTPDSVDAVVSRSPSRRTLRLGAVAVTVVAGAVAAALVAGGHKGGSPSLGTEVGTPTTQSAIAPDPSPAPPTGVKNILTGSRLVFTWTASQAGDTFKWEVEGGTTAASTIRASATVAYPGHPVCIEVWEVSAGGALSTAPTTACGPGAGS